MSRGRATLAALVALAMLALSAASPAADDAAPLAFSVLTYNTHGLPSWVAGDDPPARYPLLLEQAARFDVVLLQEDFAHQALVDAGKRHPLLVRGNASSSGWPLFAGSGLTLLARLPAAGAPVGVAYGVCAGWLGGKNDCLADKGWLLQRLRLANGVEVDIWNTHLDAGPDAADQAARETQLDLLAAAIERHSAGRPVIVGGDFNLGWDEPVERASLERFLARTGLAVAVRTPQDAWDSQLDYLLVRAGEGAPLAVREAGMAPGFVGPDGAPLSDHPPLFAVFEVR